MFGLKKTKFVAFKARNLSLLICIYTYYLDSAYFVKNLNRVSCLFSFNSGLCEIVALSIFEF